VEALGKQLWRLQLEARPSHVPHVRHDVVDVLARECPGVDLAVAALVVTELTTNVVNAYVQAGRLEVEVVCEPDAAVSPSATAAVGSVDPRVRGARRLRIDLCDEHWHGCTCGDVDSRQRDDQLPAGAQR
jgi:hypothetical protein